MWHDDYTKDEDDSAGFADQVPSLPVVILVSMFLLGFWSIVYQLGKSWGFWS